jgi:DNA-binding transcriptional ArsR family regulator
MGWWRVSADTLAESRFVLSALAETTASLIVLNGGTASHPGEREWLATHHAAYAERLAADPVTAVLVQAALRPHWIADLFTSPPVGDGEPVGEGLARVRRIPAEAAHADLAVALGGPLPAALRRPDLPERAAGLLEWVWTETVRPYWPRRRRILEADIVARTAKLGQGGWAEALAGLRPGMRWLGRGRLQINAYDNPPREIAGSQLLFVPVTPGQGWTSWDGPRRYAVMYPCSGVLAEERAAVPETLGALLGPARAAVLVLLGAPKSTTQLIALTGQGLGSVGRHLKVLLDAGLVQRRRAGRSVLYYRAPAGQVLVEARPVEARQAATPGRLVSPRPGRPGTRSPGR